MASTISKFDRTQRIRALNDTFRKSFIGGAVMVTQGVATLDGNTQQSILTRVRNYTSFNSDNDPYGEHDFGSIEIEGQRVFFKIDYYDRDLELVLPTPPTLP